MQKTSRASGFRGFDEAIRKFTIPAKEAPEYAGQMVSPERLDLLQQSWFRMLSEVGANPIAAYTVFDRLTDAYCEPHRCHHTLQHVVEMLRVAARLPQANPLAVKLAIWFHDAIRVPFANDNQIRSAELAVEWLKTLGLSADLIDRVAELIVATTHAHPPDPDDHDMAAVLDADLAILGTAEQRYWKYVNDLRMEQADVTADSYRSRRTTELKALLARPRIFLTSLVYLEGEGIARRNIQAELSRLSGGEWDLA